MRHHKKRRHPAKEQRRSEAVNEAERRALDGLFDKPAKPQAPTKPKIRAGRPKK